MSYLGEMSGVNAVLRMAPTSSSSPTPSSPNATSLTKILIPIVIISFFVVMVSVLLRVRLRRTSRRSGAATRAGAPVPEVGPALARLQRALAKGTVGATAVELDAVAPAMPFDPVLHDGDGVCAICLDEMQTAGKVRTLPCSHTFDALCVEQWVAKANRCPICNAAPVDADALAMRRTNRAASMLSEFGTPRGRRRRERDPEGGFRLAQSPVRNAGTPRAPQGQPQLPAPPPPLAPGVMPPPAAAPAAVSPP